MMQSCCTLQTDQRVHLAQAAARCSQLQPICTPCKLLQPCQQLQLLQLVRPATRKGRTAGTTRVSCCVATDRSLRQTGADALEQLDPCQPGNSVPLQGTQQPDIQVKPASQMHELKAVAQLRAEAYYAEDHSRFAQSFKRQFAAQEAESLKQRTVSSRGRSQLSECLVAVRPGSSTVLGCIDIRLPKAATGARAIGVPDGDEQGCYLLNVVVDQDHRGQGIGKQLMRAAMSRAVHHWKAERLFTHVEADNDVAADLYKSCGFRAHSSNEAKYAGTSALGRLVLLMAVAEDVQPLQQT